MKKTFKIPIYHWDLIIHKGEDIGFIEKLYWFPERATDWYGAITFTDHKEWYTRYVMAFDNNQSVWDIAHEALHCLRYIYNDRGIEFVNDDNDEHQCYILGWIVNKAYDFLNKDNWLTK